MRFRSVLCRSFVVALFLSVAAYAEDAAALYKAKCVACHGADGKGETPAGKKLGTRDFHLPEVMKQTDAELTEVVTKGRKKMPSYDGKLTPDQIKALVVQVREIGKGK